MDSYRDGLEDGWSHSFDARIKLGGNLEIDVYDKKTDNGFIVFIICAYIPKSYTL